jgi:hypothetical protein
MSEKKSPGQLFNEEMLRQQRERNAAIDARNKAAEEKKYNVTTPVEKWGDPSGKGGYKRRSTKRIKRRRSSRKRRRTMRR